MIYSFPAMPNSMIFLKRANLNSNPRSRQWQSNSSLWSQGAHSTPGTASWEAEHTRAIKSAIAAPGCLLAHSTPVLFLAGRLPAPFRHGRPENFAQPHVLRLW